MKINEIIILGEDDYEYHIDEVESITIQNKLGSTFEFKPEDMKKIEIIEIHE